MLGRIPGGSKVTGREVVCSGGLAAVGLVDGAVKSSLTGVDGGPGDWWSQGGRQENCAKIERALTKDQLRDFFYTEVDHRLAVNLHTRRPRPESGNNI